MPLLAGCRSGAYLGSVRTVLITMLPVSSGRNGMCAWSEPLGATVESVLAVGRQFNPALRAAALDTATPQPRPPGPMRLMIR
jgi:hypothetical protein